MAIPTILNRLLSHIRHSPNSPALICGESSWTYAHLGQRMLQIAAALQQAGISRQGVLLNLAKGPATVAAIYAVWLTDNHYIPVDFSQPDSRIQRIIDIAQPTLILDQDWLDTLDQQPETTISIDDFQTFTHQLAAVLYTSGSTGQPKGVQLTHTMLSFFVEWAIDDIALNARDTLANHASFAFDLSTFDLFASASVGACVWIIREEEQKNCPALIRGIATHQITVWYSVPSILAMMEKSGLLVRDVTTSLRQIVFAGEAYPIAAFRQLLEHIPLQCRLSNWYGPTETNVCTAYTVDRSRLAQLSHIPIGYPLPGLQAVIEDDAGQYHRIPENETVCGELLISGPCVTPGYLNTPESRQTELHARRCHATGDRVEMTRDGLVYRGRIDDMVKINGYRVELGEIESALYQHPAISQVALFVELGELSQQLVMVAVLKDTENKLSLLAIKQFLREKLPAYMLPQKLVLTEQLPMNANGKVDRQRLAEVAQR
ncbi:AMP-binding protein [Vibrio mangrovi]|uniref:AMP-binding protein n=1 Tax=Vibrio mangrovi TaxID=474394 RepID=A0A1Y6IND2_9VIBR|nr:AMP-binding protein [Vibrio mangrovi]MDW6004023.1 AMP-binding protein [Vibrio mangrovi]SMR99179.1 D-alanine--poly(phosphoribitol) ligase subunit 1 [Vibrio mangrovi]